jgi:sugar lactone lactonase YvrE
MSVDVLDSTRCELGEGPAWDARTGEVLWVDIMGRSLHRFHLGRGTLRTIGTPSPIGAVVPRRNAGSGWLAALEDGPAYIADNGTVEPLGTFAEADGGAEPSRPTRANDAKCDPRGRFWVGTMAYDFSAGAGALYRLDPSERVARRVLSDVTISNGLGWSADGRTMYFIDTPTQRVDALDYHPDEGTIANRRTLVEVPEAAGSPDGMTVDADGCLWVALWRGSAVHRYTPAGRLDRVVELPCAQVTSCTFAGPALDRLVVTTAWIGLQEPEPLAGATFVADVGVAGTATVAFAG